MAAETFRRQSYKNKRSETETGESHPDFGGDTTEIPDHARKEKRRSSYTTEKKFRNAELFNLETKTQYILAM